MLAIGSRLPQLSIIQLELEGVSLTIDKFVISNTSYSEYFAAPVPKLPPPPQRLPLLANAGTHPNLPLRLPLLANAGTYPNLPLQLSVCLSDSVFLSLSLSV